MATLNPESGIVILYSIIFETKNDIQFQGTDQMVQIKENNLIILAIQSKYFHPYVFQSILFHLFNKLPSLRVVNLSEELDLYLHPDYECTPTSSTVSFVPYDLSPAAEIGRFHQFIFKILRPIQILHLIIHLLCGTRIFVTSSFTTQLCFGCFSLLSIIYPLNWPSVFITALPLHLIATTGAPVPFIIGLPFNLFLRDEMEDVTIDAILNLDFANLALPDEPVFDPDLLMLLRQVDSNLTEELNMFKSTEIFPARRIQLILWQFIYAIMILASGQKEVPLSDPNLKMKIAKGIKASQSSKDISKSSLASYIADSPVVGVFIDNIIATNNEETSGIFQEFDNILKSHAMEKLMFTVKGRRRSVVR
ncbi:DENN domain-containing protein [Histomonas meleagridis]|uniref:DENN domain-containing protein n=1 Tax=Histomonas meleagridis TaxID=135588 RepID=UPI0035593A4F|nr:DENN domain-containing protein [Histomonas meleagridis]KAH0804088.1 DENN domain-containing protein [Histomonas meleagridis]